MALSTRAVCLIHYYFFLYYNRSFGIVQFPFDYSLWFQQHILVHKESLNESAE